MRYFLYRNVFHCTPAEFDRLDPQDILDALTILDVEADARRAGQMLG